LTNEGDVRIIDVRIIDGVDVRILCEPELLNLGINGISYPLIGIANT